MEGRRGSDCHGWKGAEGARLSSTMDGMRDPCAMDGMRVVGEARFLGEATENGIRAVAELAHGCGCL
jgi:hypothetical protein